MLTAYYVTLNWVRSACMTILQSFYTSLKVGVGEHLCKCIDFESIEDAVKQSVRWVTSVQFLGVFAKQI
jgi:hypothetical protein